jgi:hypothetical protein
MKTRITGFLLAGAAIALACTEDHPSSPQASRSPDVRASRIQGGRRLARTIDDVYADIAKGDSTFGGFFFDSMHVPVVYLTDITRLASVRAAGLDAFLSGRRNLPGTFRVLPAAYGYGTLTRWYACAWPRVLGLPDAVSTDIDEAHNRLRFGVRVASAIVDVETIVTQCGIPSPAVAVDVVPLPELKDGLNESLQGRVRPVRGGIQLQWGFDDNNACTIGIVGRTSEGPFFTTAAHCSVDEYALDPTRYWQTTLYNDGDSIGREFLDPPVIGHSDFPDYCPEGHGCVFADVNMSHFQSMATAQVGLIARGTSTSYDLNYPGSLVFDQAHPVFVTDVDTSGGGVGDTVCKTGRTSGTTCGAITYACFNGHWNPHYSETYGGRVIDVLCSSEANMHSDGGDSGSPVWDLSKSSSDSTVVLAGVLWGGPGGPAPGRYITYYSPFGRVVDELYWADTVTVVADYPYVVNSPALYVDLSGPTLMGPRDACWWFATAHGGTPPYTYSWQGGSFVETTDGTSGLVGTGPIHVMVSVTDAAGGEGGASMDAQVDENVTGCY